MISIDAPMNMGTWRPTWWKGWWWLGAQSRWWRWAPRRRTPWSSWTCGPQCWRSTSAETWWARCSTASSGLSPEGKTSASGYSWVGSRWDLKSMCSGGEFWLLDQFRGWGLLSCAYSNWDGISNQLAAVESSGLSWGWRAPRQQHFPPPVSPPFQSSWSWTDSHEISYLLQTFNMIGERLLE